MLCEKYRITAETTIDTQEGLMYLCDLHCDTAVSLFNGQWQLRDNTECAVSLEKAAVYDKYIQCAAIFTASALDNEQGWQTFFRVHRHFLDACTQNDCMLCTKGDMLTQFLHLPAKHTAFILTVEDARILNGNPDRLGILFDAGVRLITPVWSDETCIGGAHNTCSGLTVFGKAMAEEALERGMILDISHASLLSADTLLTLGSRYPGQICASHSNAFTITPHSRNLTDEQICRLAAIDGIIGINLYVEFLRGTGTCSADDVLRHMEYIINLCGEDHLAFGCDLDGAETPSDLPDVASLTTLLPKMQARGYSEDRIEKLFYKNACRFLVNAL